MNFLKINDRFINCENIESIFVRESEINFYDEELPSGSHTIYVRLVLKTLGGRIWDIARS